MDFFIGVITNFINYFPQDFQTEALRYVIGAVGVWFVTWVLLGGLLTNRRIRKPTPTQLRNKQIIREVRNSTILL